MSPIAKVNLLIHVLLVGMQEGIAASKKMLGFIWKPRTGSVSHPVTNFNTSSKEIFPFALLAAKSKGDRKKPSITPKNSYV